MRTQSIDQSNKGLLDKHNKLISEIIQKKEYADLTIRVEHGIIKYIKKNITFK